MGRLFERSLLLRLGAAMATITALAFVGMLSSVFIAETTQGEAGAINQAGSLRMQSYRIATDLVYTEGKDPEAYWKRTNQVINEFEHRLRSPRLTTVITTEASQTLRDGYRHISEQWEHKIKPVLKVYAGIVAPSEQSGMPPMTKEDIPLARATRDAIRARYLAIVGRFVADIDHFVKLLEDDAESKIQRLRLIQAVSLFLTVGVVFFTMYLMHTQVLVPLRDLLGCAEAARHGDFSVRTQHDSDDELGRLGRAFNVMAEDLSKIYADLEHRVREKTADLERTNRSLELLYNTTRRLNEAPLSDTTYHSLLDDIQKVVGVGPGTICLAEQGGDRAFRLASTRQIDSRLPQLCSPPNCRRCLGDGNTQTIASDSENPESPEVLALPIKEQEQQYGVLLLEVPSTTVLESWQIRLLEAVSDHIGIAINLARRANQDRRLALLEERNVIARELHDSLAQSLSYLKIQASRLDAALVQQHGGEETARSVVKELREGISSAYRQLRELLTTFRLQMNGRGLSAALEETVDEFRDRSSLRVALDNRLGGCQLSANEEIHVLQIVREALSNVVRHAHADEAEVCLQCDQNGKVRVEIADNGVGIPESAERMHHYGLAIMNERAESLGGEIGLSKRAGGGTRVELTFTLAHRSSKNETATRQGIAI